MHSLTKSPIISSFSNFSNNSIYILYNFIIIFSYELWKKKYVNWYIIIFDYFMANWSYDDFNAYVLYVMEYNYM